MPLTESQQAAVLARGNVLVVAGAGTGKTRTLVERCLHCLLTESPPASLDEILMVTFTEAAAAEIRQRIRGRLEEEQARQPGNPHWPEQLALFETSHIGTLHSFCLELVRQHFYELELDPQLAVMADEESRLLADETLETLLQKHYAGRGTAAVAVQQLIQSQAGGWDEPLRKLVLRLHHYTQTLPDPEGWFDRQLAIFADPQPTVWRDWLRQGVDEWQAHWVPGLRALGGENQVASRCAVLLENLSVNPDGKALGGALAEIVAAPAQCPHGKKGGWVNPLKEFFAEAEFLLSVTELDETGRADPLAEDWGWVRPHMTTLLQLARQFTHEFTEAKRELGMVDFHDLEQQALRLLWDKETNQPKPAAQHWREKLRFIFVDEYQDINAAQDKLIECLSRQGAQANRFLVGDVKQSIYRFRLANPHIFLNYVQAWAQPVAGATAVGKSSERGRPEALGPKEIPLTPTPLPRGEGSLAAVWKVVPGVTARDAGSGDSHSGRVIALADNFRSREGLLDFINSLFELIMQPELGGIAYDERARLRFGAPNQRAALSNRSNEGPVVELHLRLKGGGGSGPDDEADAAQAAISELEESAKEARLIALRLLELRNRRHPVWDEQLGQFRPVEWRDMAVLLRSPANKAESYAKEFARLQVPIELARGGFYQSAEILDLLSLLQVLDNPLQDLPLLAVLRSPVVGLTLNELAEVRLALSKTNFWTALVRWHDAWLAKQQQTVATDKAPVSSAAPTSPSAVAPPNPGLPPKVTAFLDRFARWRRLAREVPLSRCLEAILTETHFAEWLLTQSRGEQRRANVQRFLGLAQDFDQFQRQGLFRFLRFLEAQQLAETEPEVRAAADANAVRLLSIHQSKGLEFPVVVVADAGKPFNLTDLRADTILSETYGVCPQVRPPHTVASYPSLPYWLARRHELRELLGEELRLLYVAMTRARDLLIVSGTTTAARFQKIWESPGSTGASALLTGRCYADWLSLWFSQKTLGGGNGASEGDIGGVRWAIHDDTALSAVDAHAAAPMPAQPDELGAEPAAWEDLEHRLSWRYPFAPATQLPAKTSVSRLRRQAGEQDEEAAVWVPHAQVRREEPGPRAARRRAATAAEIGIANHRFLQLVSLDQTGSIEALRAEAQRLRDSGLLPIEQAELVNLAELARFWASDLGRKIRDHAPFVRRELEFTARFDALELARFTGQAPEPHLGGEFVVVQGIADLVVLRPDGIWLIDFKTDEIEPTEVPERAKTYALQLQMYAEALSKIYRRPVTECWLYFLAAHEAITVSVKAGEWPVTVA